MHSVLRKALRGLHRTAGRILPATMLARSYPDVPGRIHVDDLMLRLDAPEEVRRYVRGGECALRNIEESLARSELGWSDVGAFLDFPCGYGRVIRHLVNRVQPSKVTAADADPQATRFCASEFGAKPFVCRRDPHANRFP